MIGSFRLPINITSSVDITPPTITSATVEDTAKNKLIVVFSESIAIVDVTGLTITGAATPTLSTPTGSGSSTITFTLSAALTNGQSVTLNVVSSNTIKDAANNSLAATTKAITNNVASASSYDSDYQAVLDAALANGDPLPTSAQQDIDNQIMIDYKATGVYAKRDVILKAGGTASVSFKLYCWKRKIKMITYGGLTWDNDGVLPNGTNGYIDPLFVGNTSSIITQNNIGLDFVISGAITEPSGTTVGYFNGVDDTGYINILANNTSYSQASIHGVVSGTSNYGVLGYNAVNRASSVAIYFNNTYKNTTSNGISGKILLFARYWSNGNPIDNYYKNKVKFLTIGGNVQPEYSSLKTLLESI